LKLIKYFKVCSYSVQTKDRDIGHMLNYFHL
jgi:hypothetical protein